jgi:hypothetical protein
VISFGPACKWTWSLLDRDKIRMILLKSSHESCSLLWGQVCNLLWGSLILVFSLSMDAEKPYRTNC